MKIADVKGQRSFTILSEAKETIAKLAKNEYLAKIFDKNNISPDMDEETAKEIAVNRILSNLPEFMANSETELTEYFSLLEGVSPEEYTENLTAGKLVKDISDMICDSDFIGFFQLYQIQNSGKAG